MASFYLSKILYRWIDDDQCDNLARSERSEIINELEEIVDEPSPLLTMKKTLYKFEYNIIYSVNYQVPILYFHICNQGKG